jgi:hypothetical protein
MTLSSLLENAFLFIISILFPLTLLFLFSVSTVLLQAFTLNDLYKMIQHLQIWTIPSIFDACLIKSYIFAFSFMLL